MGCILTFKWEILIQNKFHNINNITVVSWASAHVLHFKGLPYKRGILILGEHPCRPKLQVITQDTTVYVHNKVYNITRLVLFEGGD